MKRNTLSRLKRAALQQELERAGCWPPPEKLPSPLLAGLKRWLEMSEPTLRNHLAQVRLQLAREARKGARG